MGVERRKVAAAQPKEQPLFPEWNALPERLTLPGGVKVGLRQAHTTDLRSYLRVLQDKQREQLAQLRISREIEQVEALLELMTKYAGRKHGITVAEVAALQLEHPES